MNYVDSLNRFAQMVDEHIEVALPKNATAKQRTARTQRFKELFQTVAPSRYQFTETVVELRADLQAATATDTSVTADVGINTGPFAVAINASYTKRNAYDYRASAFIRTVLNAIPANEDILDKLLARGSKAPNINLPDRKNVGLEALGEALGGIDLAEPEAEPKPDPEAKPETVTEPDE